MTSFHVRVSLWTLSLVDPVSVLQSITDNITNSGCSQGVLKVAYHATTLSSTRPDSPIASSGRGHGARKAANPKDDVRKMVSVRYSVRLGRMSRWPSMRCLVHNLGGGSSEQRASVLCVLTGMSLISSRSMHRAHTNALTVACHKTVPLEMISWGVGSQLRGNPMASPGKLQPTQ